MHFDHFLKPSWKYWYWLETFLWLYLLLLYANGLYYSGLDIHKKWGKHWVIPDRWLFSLCLNRFSEGKTTISMSNWFHCQTIFTVSTFLLAYKWSLLSYILNPLFHCLAFWNNTKQILWHPFMHWRVFPWSYRFIFLKGWTCEEWSWAC